MPSGTSESLIITNFHLKLCNDLQKENWGMVYSTQNPNIAWSAMKDIKKEYPPSRPIITKNVKGKRSP